jgi:V-type H+-transporting ATPase subunit D
MLQTSSQIIDEVLRITNRRVNAMEYVLIPKCKDLIAFGAFGLEENEREEFYRLKKVQWKRKVMRELAEQQRLERFQAEDGKPKEAESLLKEDSSTDSDLLL